MFRAIGFVIVLYTLSTMLSGAFDSFERATIAVFGTVETAANVSTSQLERVAEQQR